MRSGGGEGKRFGYRGGQRNDRGNGVVEGERGLGRVLERGKGGERRLMRWRDELEQGVGRKMGGIRVGKVKCSRVEQVEGWSEMM